MRWEQIISGFLIYTLLIVAGFTLPVLRKDGFLPFLNQTAWGPAHAASIPLRSTAYPQGLIKPASFSFPALTSARHLAAGLKTKPSTLGLETAINERTVQD